jgi:hypothetical protein
MRDCQVTPPVVFEQTFSGPPDRAASEAMTSDAFTGWWMNGTLRASGIARQPTARVRQFDITARRRAVTLWG